MRTRDILCGGLAALLSGSCVTETIRVPLIRYSEGQENQVAPDVFIEEFLKVDGRSDLRETYQLHRDSLMLIKDHVEDLGISEELIALVKAYNEHWRDQGHSKKVLDSSELDQRIANLFTQVWPNIVEELTEGPAGLVDEYARITEASAQLHSEWIGETSGTSDRRIGIDARGYSRIISATERRYGLRIKTSARTAKRKVGAVLRKTATRCKKPSRGSFLYSLRFALSEQQRQIDHARDTRLAELGEFADSAREALTTVEEGYITELSVSVEDKEEEIETQRARYLEWTKEMVRGHKPRVLAHLPTDTPESHLERIRTYLDSYQEASETLEDMETILVEATDRFLEYFWKRVSLIEEITADAYGENVDFLAVEFERSRFPLEDPLRAAKLDYERIVDFSKAEGKKFYEEKCKR